MSKESDFINLTCSLKCPIFINLNPACSVFKIYLKTPDSIIIRIFWHPHTTLVITSHQVLNCRINPDEHPSCCAFLVCVSFSVHWADELCSFQVHLHRCHAKKNNAGDTQNTASNHQFIVSLQYGGVLVSSSMQWAHKWTDSFYFPTTHTFTLNLQQRTYKPY